MFDHDVRRFAAMIAQWQRDYDLTKAELLILLELVEKGTVSQASMIKTGRASALTFGQAFKKLTSKGILKSGFDFDDKRKKIDAFKDSFLIENAFDMLDEHSLAALRRYTRSLVFR